MGIDKSVMVGGEAGQGIQSVGDLLALCFQKAGLYIMAINDYESRIRGGHSFFQMRIRDVPVKAPDVSIHLLVALDKRSFELHADELVDGGMVMMDKNDAPDHEKVIPVAVNELAKEAGGKILANTVAAGAALCLLGIPLEILDSVISSYFAAKGEKLTNQNRKAAELGYDAVKDKKFAFSGEHKEAPAKGGILDGAKAMALGALAADCRMAAFYPMSPATGILTAFNQFSDDFPVVVEQAEDEISAINMAIGASFAGVRAMTATSGGGFCLMTEGIGLAAITETPVVVINAQRPGPATGLPTRTAQGDLLFMLHASQDEYPRFIFAPGTVEEVFETAIRAFHLADKYQVPVFILVDHYLNASVFMTTRPLAPPDTIERFVAKDSDLDDPGGYLRFKNTEYGVSPRVLPCMGKALIMSTGNEHTEDGHISEDKTVRTMMVDKRFAKEKRMKTEIMAPELYGEEGEILLVGWGSTKGAMEEAVDILNHEGIKCGCISFADIWPFPVEKAKELLQKARRFYVVEGNKTGQFERLIRTETGIKADGIITRYDGRPFYAPDIAREISKKER